MSQLLEFIEGAAGAPPRIRALATLYDRRTAFGRETDRPGAGDRRLIVEPRKRQAVEDLATEELHEKGQVQHSATTSCASAM